MLKRHVLSTTQITLGSPSPLSTTQYPCYVTSRWQRERGRQWNAAAPPDHICYSQMSKPYESVRGLAHLLKARSMWSWEQKLFHMSLLEANLPTASDRP